MRCHGAEAYLSVRQLCCCLSMVHALHVLPFACGVLRCPQAPALRAHVCVCVCVRVCARACVCVCVPICRLGACRNVKMYILDGKWQDVSDVVNVLQNGARRRTASIVPCSLCSPRFYCALFFVYTTLLLCPVLCVHHALLSCRVLTTTPVDQQCALAIDATATPHTPTPRPLSMVISLPL